MQGKNFGTAYFKKDARWIGELESYKKSCIGQRKPSQPYIIEKVVEISKIDFENFSTDLFVARRFIEENHELMTIDSEGIVHTILVTEVGGPDVGILVNSEKQEYPAYTAIYHKTERLKFL